MYCVNCGKEVSGMEFCPACGTATPKAKQPVPLGYVPPEIKKWNWGAFLFGGFWGIGNKTYLPLLCFVPILNIVWIFVCGAKGNEWAFKSGNYTPEDVHKFLTIQKTWNRAGLTRLVFGLIGLVLGIFFMVLFSYAIFAAFNSGNYGYSYY